MCSFVTAYDVYGGEVNECGSNGVLVYQQCVRGLRSVPKDNLAKSLSLFLSRYSIGTSRS